jgi:hypothetical protein
MWWCDVISMWCIFACTCSEKRLIKLVDSLLNRCNMYIYIIVITWVLGTSTYFILNDPTVNWVTSTKARFNFVSSTKSFIMISRFLLFLIRHNMIVRSSRHIRQSGNIIFIISITYCRMYWSLVWTYFTLLNGTFAPVFLSIIMSSCSCFYLEWLSPTLSLILLFLILFNYLYHYFKLVS